MFYHSTEVATDQHDRFRGPINENHRGCFIDKGGANRLFKFLARKDNSVVPHSCLETCLNLNMNYAGVQFHNECWCSHTPPPWSARTKDSECNTACNAANFFTCGGPNRLNVYFNYGKTGLYVGIGNISKELSEALY